MPLPKIMIASAALLAATLIAASAAQGQTVWYVNDDGDADNSCMSWPDACPELQTALSLASAGDQIWVAEGTYKPDYDVNTGQHTGDRETSFQLISGVALYGGFDGTEESLEDRAALFDQTILSGDLAGNDGPEFKNNDENNYHVVMGGGTDNSAVLDGFKITGGNANGHTPTYDLGGGMYNEGGDPYIQNCIFEMNSANLSGGGIRNYNSSPIVSDCMFLGNRAKIGGGMSNGQGSNCWVTNCMFIDNAAPGPSSNAGGGGMANSSNAPVVIGCSFIGNTALDGGGMLNANASPTVTNCLFVENSAPTSSGGGICNYVNGHPIVTNCAFIRNTGLNGGGICNMWTSSTVLNCTFLGNVGSGGGGIFNLRSSAQLIAGCAFIGNIAEVGGGISCFHDSNLTVIDCTFSANAAEAGRALGFDSFKQQDPSNLLMVNSILWEGGSEIWNNDNSILDIGYSDVQGGWPGNGNIDADPLFVLEPDPGPDGEWGTKDDDYGDLHFQPGSPCIDVADNSAVPADATDLDDDGNTSEPIPLDLDGNARFIDDPETPDTGLGECSIVDMGAYEFQKGTTCCPADFDGDGTVGAADLALLLGSWGPCEGCPADLDGNGQVGAFDLALLLGSWGLCE